MVLHRDNHRTVSRERLCHFLRLENGKCVWIGFEASDFDRHHVVWTITFVLL